MRTKLTLTEPQAALDRLLDALAHELIDVSDDEILAAAKELGMNPMMKGSAAFLGLRVAPFADLAEWAEFFQSEHFRASLAALNLKGADAPAELEPKAKTRRPKRQPTLERKH
jgi:hypothetical protein